MWLLLFLCLKFVKLIGYKVRIDKCDYYLLVDRQRQRHRDRNDPNGGYEQQADSRRWSLLERSYDDEVPIDSDRRRSQRRDVNADAERHWNEVTQRLTERP